MRAEDLVGNEVLRTRPVILGKGVMDLSFMDPEKPYRITKYNAMKRGITLINTYGCCNMYVTNEYDDDNWILAKDYDPEKVKVPSGYKSLDLLLAERGFIDESDSTYKCNMKQEEDNECEFVYCQSADYCLDTLKSYLNKNKEAVVRVVGGSANVSRFIIFRYNEEFGHYIMINMLPMEPDIVFCDCNSFSEMIDKIIERNIIVLPDILIIPLYFYYKCGYKELNKLLDLHDIGYSTQIYSSSCVFIGTILSNGDMQIRLAETGEIQTQKVEDNIVLSVEESFDLEDKYSRGMRIFSEFSLDSK